LPLISVSDGPQRSTLTVYTVRDFSIGFSISCFAGLLLLSWPSPLNQSISMCIGPMPVEYQLQCNSQGTQAGPHEAGSRTSLHRTSIMRNDCTGAVYTPKQVDATVSPFTHRVAQKPVRWPVRVQDICSAISVIILLEIFFIESRSERLF